MTYHQLCILMTNLWVLAYNRNDKRILGFGSFAWIIISFIEWVRVG
jgi:hypothetical protein